MKLPSVLLPCRAGGRIPISGGLVASASTANFPLRFVETPRLTERAAWFKSSQDSIQVVART